MSRGTLAVIALSALLVAWFVAGHLYNRRRGRHLHRWLASGLDALGGEREEGWVGSPATGARINVKRAEAPFRRLEITLLLANRETPFLWLADHLLGRRDRITIRATLRSPGRGEVVVRAGGQVKGLDESWTREEGPHGLGIAYRGHNARRLVVALDPWLEAYGAHLSQFDWRKQDPHISLQLRIAGLLQTEPEAPLAELGTALLANGQG